TPSRPVPLFPCRAARGLVDAALQRRRDQVGAGAEERPLAVVARLGESDRLALAGELVQAVAQALEEGAGLEAEARVGEDQLAEGAPAVAGDDGERLSGDGDDGPGQG